MDRKFVRCCLLLAMAETMLLQTLFHAGCGGGGGGGGAAAVVPPVPPFVTGHVLDASTGNPVAGATVDLSNGTRTVTDATGTYVFFGVRPGTHTITISGANLVTNSSTVTVSPSDFSIPGPATFVQAVSAQGTVAIANGSVPTIITVASPTVLGTNVVVTIPAGTLPSGTIVTVTPLLALATPRPDSLPNRIPLVLAGVAVSASRGGPNFSPPITATVPLVIAGTPGQGLTVVRSSRSIPTSSNRLQGTAASSCTVNGVNASSADCTLTSTGTYTIEGQPFIVLGDTSQNSGNAQVIGHIESPQTRFDTILNVPFPTFNPPNSPSSQATVSNGILTMITGFFFPQQQGQTAANAISLTVPTGQSCDISQQPIQRIITFNGPANDNFSATLSLATYSVSCTPHSQGGGGSSSRIIK